MSKKTENPGTWDPGAMTTVDALPLLPESPAELDRYYGDAPRGVRANMVTTVDGAGAFAGRTKAISSPADQRLLSHLRHHADAVLVGSTTVQAEKYGPVKISEDVQQQRMADGYDALPPLVIVTARGALSPTLSVFGQPGPRPIIATLQSTAAVVGELNDVADLIVVGEAAIDPVRLLEELRRRGLERVLCEGGPFLLSSLIELDLVDDMCLTLSPYLAGSQPTTPQPPSAREGPSRLKLRHVLTHDDLLYLRYSRAPQ
jgi:riboflavin-specific deaminase-like protein